jgi:hypothetical protein
MKLSPKTRLHQARLQVNRARERLRSGASGVPAAQAFPQLDELAALAGDDSPVSATLGEPQR